MSITINGSNSTETENKLTYNFYTIPLQSSSDSISQNIVKTTENDKTYIKITNYPYNGKSPHITHDIFGANVAFTVTEMRIYKGLYNSADLQLIIETSSSKNEINYICIPLNRGNDNGSPNDLDKVIQSMCLDQSDSCPATLNLNNLITAPKTIYYVIKSDSQRIFNNPKNSSGKRVSIIIFDNAIKITGASFNAASNTISDISIGVDGSDGTSGGSGGYKRIKAENITSPFNLSNSNIYIDCNGDASDDVTEVLDGTYKLTEPDIKSIFFCFFFGSIIVLTFYVLDKLAVGKTTSDGLTKFFKYLHELYDEENKKILGMNVMIWVIIINFLLCFSLYISSFLSKTSRVNLLISALYFTMTLFCIIYVKFLRSVTNPPNND